MWDNTNLPEFGCLSGVKIVHATQSTSGPFGVQLLADYGADVIWAENCTSPDITRFSNSFAVDSERKNQRNLGLNLGTPEGKEILCKLLKYADVFIENGKGGQYAKWGLTDEYLWSINPKLIIAHISGFGETGLPEYIGRPSYDPIAQAFSGYTYSNGNLETAPYPVGPYAADFFTALYLAVSVLAALYKVRETGKGESIDLAQYELMMRTQQYQADWFTSHVVKERAGFPPAYAGCGCFQCKDGEYLQCFLMGAGVLRKAIEFFGLEYGSDAFPKNISLIYANDEKSGIPFNNAIKAYLATKTADEAQKELLALGLAVSKVNSLADLENDPHVKTREVISEWTSFKGEKVKSVGPVPKFKNYPAKIWRAAPYLGMDNEEILSQIGFTNDEISSLYEKKVIGNDEEMKFCAPLGKPKKTL